MLDTLMYITISMLHKNYINKRNKDKNEGIMKKKRARRKTKNPAKKKASFFKSIFAKKKEDKKKGQKKKRFLQWLPRICFKKEKKVQKPEKKAEKPKIRIKSPILILIAVLIVIDLIVLHHKGLLPFYAALIPSAIIIMVALIFSIIHIRKVKKAQKITDNVRVAMIKQALNLKKRKYETELDMLYNIVKKSKRITITEISEGFKISKEKAEEWARILDEHELLELYYPAIGEPELRWKEKRL